MKISSISEHQIPGVKLINFERFIDQRGFFTETFRTSDFIDNKLNFFPNGIMQTNESFSQKNVLRGLHFQNPPHAQGKLVRVITGSVYDVAVDIRKDSKTYGKWFGLELTEKNKWMMFVPPGFAHGFLTLENNTIFSYKCTNFYNKASEDCLLWNDKDLKIDWNFDKPLLSAKDLEGKPFKGFLSQF